MKSNEETAGTGQREKTIIEPGVCDLTKPLRVLTSGGEKKKEEGSARGNCHKCRVTTEKQVLSLEVQGLGDTVVTSHTGTWINHSPTAQQQLRVPEGERHAAAFHSMETTLHLIFRNDFTKKLL